MARLEKKHIYRVYRNGTYLGKLSNVKSEFTYNQQINTAGAQLQIVVGQSADTANLPSSPILDETGVVITDEVSSPLLDEGAAEIVGDSNPDALIQNHNDIIVTEYSDYYPNGVVVYDGYISRWKANYGGNEDITITCLNQSQDLAHHITPGTDTAVIDQSHTSTNDSFGFWYDAAQWPYGRYGQTFTTGSGVTNLSSITLRLLQNTGLASGTATMYLWQATADPLNGVPPIATATKVIAGASYVDYSFVFGVTVTPNTSYFFTLVADPASSFGSATTWMGMASESPSTYIGGQIWVVLGTPTTYVLPGTPQSYYFKTYHTVTTTSKTYTNEDVTNILTDIFDYYVSDGGLVSAPPGGWAATGITIPTYAMKVTTILQAIQKIKELGPSDWYWYVDPATNILYYQQQGTTPDHYIVKGRHIQMLDLEATKENIINDVLFTGGNDGTGSGENVFVRVKDQDSIDAGRVGLALPVDSRVDGTDGADTAIQLSQNLIDRNNAEAYSTTVTIIDGTYDTKLYNMGDMVKPENFGTFPDTLLLAIVARNPIRDGITLTLGVLPKRASEQVEAIQKGLFDAQTLDNPDVPS